MNAGDIVKESFSYLFQLAEGLMISPKRFIITVPVCFTEMQRLCMRKAAEQENCELAEIITEPFAGIFSCRSVFEEMQDRQTQYVLIFDSGGSTTDMCLFEIRRKGEKYHVSNIAANGFRFAGDNVTELLYQNRLKEHFDPLLDKEAHKEMKLSYQDDPSQMPPEDSDEYREQFENFRTQKLAGYMPYINQYKELLGTNVSHPDRTVDWNAVLSRDELNQASLCYHDMEEILINENVADKIAEAVDDILTITHLMPEEIDKVILIGGTSKLPYFRNVLQKCLNCSNEETEQKFQLLSGTANSFAVSVGAVNYLLYKEENFIVRSRAPYEVGIMKDGKFRCLRDRTVWIGEESVPKNVTPDTRADGKRVLRMFQRFRSRDSEIYPMGEFILDDTLLPNGSCMLGLTINQTNELIGTFYPDGSLRNGITVTLNMEGGFSDE